MSTIIKPMGTLLKKGQDEFWNIADAWRGNKSLVDWGMRAVFH